MPKRKKPDFNISAMLASKIIGVSHLTIPRMIARGEIEGTWKKGNYRGSWQISYKSVEKYLENNN